MKTILLISPYWKESHRWMVSSYKMAELWQRIGYRVVVVSMAEKNHVTDVSETLTLHGRKDLFLPDPWNYGIAWGFSSYVLRVIENERPAAIVVNKILFWTSISIIMLRLRKKNVLLITDALVGMTWWPRGRLTKVCAALYAWTLGWLILLCAHRVTFFHPQPEQLLRRLRIARKSQVIPTGIDPSLYRSAENKFARDTVTITYVGRLESVKGVDDFLAAVVPLRDEYPHLEVQVVGFYEEGHPLVEQYHGKARFTGLRDDIPDILAETEIFVMPSYSEGLSNALMEAMSSSCACIATEVGGNAFLVHNGVSGFLFPPGDREALRSHVRRLLDDPAKMKQLGLAARKRIEECFSWDRVGEEYRAFFEAQTQEMKN